MSTGIEDAYETLKAENERLRAAIEHVIDLMPAVDAPVKQYLMLTLAAARGGDAT